MKKRKVEIFTEKGTVRKYYFNQEDLQKELYIYSKHSGITPKLLGYEENWIEIEYIDSVNLWNIEKPDFAEIGALYTKLHDLEEKSGNVICHIDNNPQNILYSKHENRYYLIDFVDWRMESAEFDIIHLLMFWINSKSHEDYKELVNNFVVGYTKHRVLNYNHWKEDFRKAKHYFDTRRRAFDKNECCSSETEKNLEYLQNFTI